MEYHCWICDQMIEEDAFTENSGLCDECAADERELESELNERT
jgi:hypothetical protein